MNKRRLLKLADLLEADAKNKKGVRFNMRSVVNIDNRPKDGVVELSCGTSACAMGLAAISGAFQRAGLSYRVKHYDVLITLDGKDLGYDRAGMAVFGLSMNDADFLFTPAQYPDGQTLTGAEGERFVAKRIRDFVAGKSHPETAVSP